MFLVVSKMPRTPTFKELKISDENEVTTAAIPYIKSSLLQKKLTIS